MDKGWFVRPTLFADLDNDTDAVRIANDSDYGLGGTVWSSDPDRAMGIASAVHTSTIGINGYIPDPSAPFGGVKASGIGREFGPEGLATYQQLKSIYQFACASVTRRDTSLVPAMRLGPGFGT